VRVVVVASDGGRPSTVASDGGERWWSEIQTQCFLTLMEYAGQRFR